MKPLLLLILLSVGVYATWDGYIAPVVKKHFPREMVVTNKDGDMLKITLIRRDEKNAYFRKEGNQILYRYEIAQLNFLSRCKVKLFPLPSPKSMRTKHDIEDDPAQMHLNSMYIEHEDRKKQLRVLEVKMVAAPSMMTKQSIQRDINTLIDKINVLVYRIEEFKYRYPHLISSSKKLDIIKKKEKETKESKSTDKASDLFKLLGN